MNTEDDFAAFLEEQLNRATEECVRECDELWVNWLLTGETGTVSAVHAYEGIKPTKWDNCADARERLGFGGDDE
jgi:hypothetical protein